MSNTLKLYNMRDCYATHYSTYSLIQELKEAGLEKFYRELVQPLAWLIVKLNLAGIYVDKAMREEAYKDFERQLVQANSDLATMAGKELNPDADEFRDFLYGDLKLRCIARTATGLPRADEDTLRKLAQLYPDIGAVIETALQIRETKKMLSTFMPPWWVAEDGRVYPAYRVGPATGRLACKRPNFQNIPEGIARKVFCAPPGKLLIYADYNQVELRILAILAHDESLLEVFRLGKDVHDANARDLFGLGPDAVVGPRQRYFAKTFVYGLNYGGGVETIRGRGSEVFHDIPMAVMQGAADRYFAAHPAILEFRKQIAYEVRTKRRSVNAFGRPRIFFNPPEEALRQGYNNPMQSGAGDLLNKKVIELDKRIDGTWVLQVHDCLAYEVDEDKAEHEAKVLKEVLEEPVSEFGNYSFPAKVKVGMSWGDFV